MTRELEFLDLYLRLMIDYFSYLLLNKIILFPLNFYNLCCMTASSECHSEFTVTAHKCRLQTIAIFLSVACELSQPMGKTEFSSTAKNRTDSVS